MKEGSERRMSSFLSVARKLRKRDRKLIGEWALEEAIERGNIKVILKNGFINWSALKEEFIVERLSDSLKSNPKTNQLFEIAVDCLGKKEVEEQLKGESELK